MSGSTDPGVHRRLAAILAADVVGFSALMGVDEERTLARIKQLRQDIIRPRLIEHGGRLVKVMGDGFLTEFPSSVHAVRCAAEIQHCLSTEHHALGLCLRIGINLGDVIIDEDGDIYGEGVNIAVRLEQMAEPGSVWISGKVFDEIRNKLSYRFEDRGERQAKNIASPIRGYCLVMTPATAANAQGQPPAAGKPSIAVLPFTNMSGDREQEYFADGIAEDIITELSRISAFLVIARNSTFTYKVGAVDVKQVGRELGVDYVLEGSVRRTGERMRVSAQLIDAKTGAHIWAEKYDRPIADIFDVQDEVTRSVVASTQTQVILNEGFKAERSPSMGFNTWALNKQAWREIYQLTRESLQTARSIGKSIIEQDPDSPKGYQVVATADHHLVWMGFSSDRDEMRDEALRAIQEAIRLDDRDEYTQWSYGNILGVLFGRYGEATMAFGEALSINPNFSLAFGSLGTVQSQLGDPEESIRNIQTAIRLNPRDPSIFFRYSGLAMANFAKRDYSQARDWAQRAIARRSSWWLAHVVLIASLSHLDDGISARNALSTFQTILPNASLRTLPFPSMHSDQLARLRVGLIRAGIPD
ncbi:adenylate cyclase [Mesorhizobium sp. L-8-10]|uniref:adenylate/guanylate cyclase domain-containing protein n=1 Tax=Mesorhizobium sp. L-8-10 TaxID=2744523 RepID=UPI001925EFD8|nr:adenylate/guanylate cyclase domain-containing protein [Mesorhizobium sp. L-8-10]BCH32939.1 adenylate cyclase [Mesorhizobium sp. L-8-10]